MQDVDELVKRLRGLASPDAEAMPDEGRLTRVIHAANDAADALTALSARVAELEQERDKLDALWRETATQSGQNFNEWLKDKARAARAALEKDNG